MSWTLPRYLGTLGISLELSRIDSAGPAKVIPNREISRADEVAVIFPNHYVKIQQQGKRNESEKLETESNSVAVLEKESGSPGFVPSHSRPGQSVKWQSFHTPKEEWFLCGLLAWSHGLALSTVGVCRV